MHYSSLDFSRQMGETPALNRFFDPLMKSHSFQTSGVFGGSHVGGFASDPLKFPLQTIAGPQSFLDGPIDHRRKLLTGNGGVGTEEGLGLGYRLTFGTSGGLNHPFENRANGLSSIENRVSGLSFLEKPRQESLFFERKLRNNEIIRAAWIWRPNGKQL